MFREISVNGQTVVQGSFSEYEALTMAKATPAEAADAFDGGAKSNFGGTYGFVSLCGGGTHP
jgi:hypothetical protein